MEDKTSCAVDKLADHVQSGTVCKNLSYSASSSILTDNEVQDPPKLFLHENGSKYDSKMTRKICSNPDCGSKTNLRTAPYFVCAYFGVLVERCGVRRVCQRCYKEAENHQNVLVKMLRDHKSIVLGPKKPKNHMVTIDDEECSDESIESPEELEIEEDIEELVKHLSQKYKFEQQVDASIKHLEKKFISNNEKMAELDISYLKLEKSLDALRKELYASHEPKICNVDPIDVDAQGNVTKHTTLTAGSPSSTMPLIQTTRHIELPPTGMFTYTPVKITQAIYAMRSSLLSPWGKGRIIRMKENAEILYVVRFDTGGKPRTFPLKYLAYAEPSPVQLSVGARVIAQYVEDKDGKLKPSSYYAGVIAEAPKYLNQYRYLVFFDDGYAQYCTHEQVMMVCHSSKDVWHDIHMNSRSFVSNYLKQYPERAMVKLQRGQTVKTELNGHWFQGRVETVDASLANIYFATENRFEWIYRGSTRLHPLFDLLANAEARKNQGATRPTHNMALVHKKKNTPYVEYTRGDVDRSPHVSVPVPSTLPVPTSSSENVVRAVARKSTSKVFKTLPVSSPPLRAEDSTLNAEHKGRFKFRQNETYQTVEFEPHQCGSKCTEDFPYTDGDYKNLNPLSIPMLCGWSREVANQRHGERLSIIYRAPCGRRTRNMDEVHRFLRLTGSQLGVDLFCFDSFVHCFTEFEPEVVYSKINDITYGKENVRVSCVNSIDRSNPEYVDYSTKRTPREGVNLNLDPDFLVCCDCTDDCQDKEKCQCWQLTIKATAWGPSGKVDQNAGYQYRRLMQNVVTGVYECNSQCSCRKTCLNRVAQRPLHLRLQLFRTEKRGWGIRCLDDIPKGQFICVYAGQLLTEQEANDDGKQFGDEYLAELDLIESIEQAKDGYESDVDIDIDQQSDGSLTSNTDDDSGGSSDTLEPKNDPRTKIEDSLGGEKVLATSSTSIRTQRDDSQKKTREFYGPNEHCYVMDAKSTGNIGRYLNHCCKPNVFVQNIFVDTQDLRFPWVGFFAYVFIRAGTELTWDYSYQVGSVPDKTLYCHCGAKECRGRLL